MLAVERKPFSSNYSKENNLKEWWELYTVENTFVKYEVFCMTYKKGHDHHIMPNRKCNKFAFEPVSQNVSEAIVPSSRTNVIKKGRAIWLQAEAQLASLPTNSRTRMGLHKSEKLQLDRHLPRRTHHCRPTGPWQDLKLPEKSHFVCLKTAWLKIISITVMNRKNYENEYTTLHTFFPSTCSHVTQIPKSLNSSVLSRRNEVLVYMCLFCK